jgi:hypothetical protein
MGWISDILSGGGRRSDRNPHDRAELGLETCIGLLSPFDGLEKASTFVLLVTRARPLF